MRIARKVIEAFEVISDAGWGFGINALAQSVIAPFIGLTPLAAVFSPATVLIGCLTGAVAGTLLRRYLKRPLPEYCPKSGKVISLDEYRQYRSMNR